MKLDAIRARGGPDERHELTGGRSGADVGVGRESVGADHQRVIPSDVERRWKIAKEMIAAMGHRGCESMHRGSRGDDLGSHQGGEALMPEADAKDRNPTEGGAQDSQAEGCFTWMSRAGRDDDRGGIEVEKGIDGLFVGTSNDAVRAERAEELREVERERVVIVDDQDQRARCPKSPRRSLSLAAVTSVTVATAGVARCVRMCTGERRTHQRR